ARGTAGWRAARRAGRSGDCGRQLRRAHYGTDQWPPVDGCGGTAVTEAGAIYGQPGGVTGLAIGMVVLLLAQTAFVWWVSRRMAELAHIRERMSRLADGLALLTDTTEAGLTTIA